MTGTMHGESPVIKPAEKGDDEELTHGSRSAASAERAPVLLLPERCLGSNLAAGAPNGRRPRGMTAPGDAGPARQQTVNGDQREFGSTSAPQSARPAPSSTSGTPCEEPRSRIG